MSEPNPMPAVTPPPTDPPRKSGASSWLLVVVLLLLGLAGAGVALVVVVVGIATYVFYSRDVARDESAAALNANDGPRTEVNPPNGPVPDDNAVAPADNSANAKPTSNPATPEPAPESVAGAIPLPPEPAEPEEIWVEVPDTRPRETVLQLGNGDDSLRLEKTVGLVDYRQKFTVEYLVRFSPESGARHLLLSTYAAANRHPAVQKKSGHVGCQFLLQSSGFIKGSGGQIFTGGPRGEGPDLASNFIASPNFWKHVAFTCDGKNVAVYMDGKREFSSQIRLSDKDYEASPLDVHLGNHDFTFQTPAETGLNARLRALRVSRLCRYTGDFTPLTKLELDADTEALLDFSQAQQDKVPDLSGHEHHGVLKGGQWVSVPRDEDPAKPTPVVTKPGAAKPAYTVAFLPLQNNAYSQKIGEQLRSEMASAVRWKELPPDFDYYEHQLLFLPNRDALRTNVGRYLGAHALVLVKPPKDFSDPKSPTVVVVCDGQRGTLLREARVASRSAADIAAIVVETLGKSPQPNAKRGLLREVATTQSSAESKRLAAALTWLLKSEARRHSGIVWIDAAPPSSGSAPPVSGDKSLSLAGECQVDASGRCAVTVRLLSGDNELGKVQREGLTPAESVAEVTAAVRTLLAKHAKLAAPAPLVENEAEFVRKLSALRSGANDKELLDLAELAAVLYPDNAEVRFHASAAAARLAEKSRDGAAVYSRSLEHLEKFVDLGGCQPKYLADHGLELKEVEKTRLTGQRLARSGIAPGPGPGPGGPFPIMPPVHAAQRTAVENMIVSLTKQRLEATVFWMWLLTLLPPPELFDGVGRVVGRIEDEEYAAEQVQAVLRLGGPLGSLATFPPARPLLTRLTESKNEGLRKLAAAQAAGPPRNVPSKPPAIPAAPPPLVFRLWKLEDGRSAELAVVAIEGDVVVLRTRAGAAARIPTDKLSEPDKAWLDGWKQRGGK